MKVFRLVGLALGLTILMAGVHALAAPPKGTYHLIKKVSLPAAPGGGEYFDYITVDPDARRVYISHGTEVVILNADDYSVLGTIGGLQRCHGVALVKELNKGFITDGDAQKVFIFDIKTLKVTGEVKTNQPDTDSIIYDPASKHLFTFNGTSHNTTVIDPVKEVVIQNLDLVGRVEFPAVDGKGMVYDNNEEKNEVVAIDSKAIAIKARWPVAPEGQAVALAMDRKEQAHLFRRPQSTIHGHVGCRQRKGDPVVPDQCRSGYQRFRSRNEHALCFDARRHGSHLPRGFAQQA